MNELNPLLTVDHLSISFAQYTHGLRQHELHVVRDLNITVHAGEVVAVIGSSGSGKSLLAQAILGLVPANATIEGQIMYDGQPLTGSRQATLRGHEIALVPQSVQSLDPLVRVKGYLQPAGGRAARVNAVQRQNEWLARYQLAPEHTQLYPHELSGGMARRVLMATALLGEARLIIADEPTPGLHAEIVSEALQHFRQWADEGRAIMLITHDLEAALTVADRIAVLYAGTTVETARAADFYGDGQAVRHPYTRALWRALPGHDFAPLPGVQPAPDEVPVGCAFAPRCPASTNECTLEPPVLRELRGGIVRCWHAT